MWLENIPVKTGTIEGTSSLGSTKRKRASSLDSAMSSASNLASNLASSTRSRVLRSMSAPSLFGSAPIRNKVWTRVIGNKEWSRRKISVSDNVLYKIRGDNSYDCGVRSACPCSMVSWTTDTNDKQYIIGLSLNEDTTDEEAAYSKMTFGLQCDGKGDIWILKEGRLVEGLGSVGKYNKNDTFKVELTGDEVIFTQTCAIDSETKELHRSKIQPSSELWACASFFSVGAKASNVQVTPGAGAGVGLSLIHI